MLWIVTTTTMWKRRKKNVQLGRRRWRYHWTQNECKVCQRPLASPYSLQKHLLRHAKKLPFECHLCPGKCATLANLAAHICSHTEVKPFPCTACPAAFTRKVELDAHFGCIHSGEEALPVPAVPGSICPKWSTEITHRAVEILVWSVLSETLCSQSSWSHNPIQPVILNSVTRYFLLCRMCPFLALWTTTTTTSAAARLPQQHHHHHGHHHHQQTFWETVSSSKRSYWTAQLQDLFLCLTIYCFFVKYRHLAVK